MKTQPTSDSKPLELFSCLLPPSVVPSDCHQESRPKNKDCEAPCSRQKLPEEVQHKPNSVRIITTDKPSTPTAEHLADCQMHKAEAKTENLSLLRDLLS